MDVRETHASLRERRYEDGLLTQLDCGCALWINRRFIAIACVVFVGGALVGAVNGNQFHRTFSELSGDVTSALTMPDKSESHLAAPNGGISFVRIATQNVQASIYTFVLGISFGIGTLIMLAINGAVVGYLLLALLNSSPSHTTIASIFAHAPIELAGLVICGAAGLRLGWGLVRAIASSSIWHLQVATYEALSLIPISVGMLLTASAIEAFVSFSPCIPSACKLLIGAASVLIMLGCIYLSRLYWMHCKARQCAGA